MSYNPNPNPSGPAYTPGGSYNQSGPSSPMVSQAGIQDIINSWTRALTQPSVQTLAAEVPRTSQNRIIMSVGLATVVSAIIGLITGVFTPGGFVGGFVSSLIGTPLRFLIVAAVLYFAARMMKGTGTFEQTAWVLSTFYAPLLIVQSLHIPLLGGLIGLVASIYSIYLIYLTLQAVHRLDGTNAIVAMLLSVGIAIVVFIVLLIITAPFAILSGLMFG